MMEETMNKVVYLDSASATYVNREVLQEMMPAFNSYYGNPLSIHGVGRNANAMVEQSKQRIADAIKAEPKEIHFTSGAVEANNWAILGIARANKKKGNHIITSKVEDNSILLACKQLEKEGFEVTYVGCDDNGVVSLAQIMGAIKQNTILVSINVANNEVGTIQNLNAIARTVKEKDIVFHCDATCALGAMPLDVQAMPIDAMTLASDLIYGPKGVGALYVKKTVKIDQFVMGDGGKRPDNPNVPAIVGFGKAVEIATRDISTSAHKLKIVRDYFVRNVKEKIENVTLNGHQYQRIANNANLEIECVDNEALVYMLAEEGICASVVGTRLEPSHTLLAMKKEPEE
ncbi:MAG: cysteine desulfurase, partial [Clostridia bacterium]|nr:cysteine desulfurase [Clostridia bacterium]